MFAQIVSALLAFFFIAFPCINPAPVSDDIRLSADLISDTHIDARLPLGKLILKQGVKDVARRSRAVDALVVSGDLTNYGDGESLAAFYEIVTKYFPSKPLIIASGNHDIGHVEDLTNEEARQRLIEYYNRYTGENTENIYYSLDVKGYTFIVLGDQSEDGWDRPEYFADQLEFLDSELTRAQSGGKPAFVVCHVPVAGTNGQTTVWEEGSAREEYDLALRAVLERHSGAFFISGHLHTGLNSVVTHELFGVHSVETINGVTYVNLPTYTLVNRYGIPWNGMGLSMEVYDDRVEFRARNYLTGKWYSGYGCTVALNGQQQ